MKKPNDQIKTPGAEGPPDGAAAPQTQEPTEPQAPAPKPPPPLPPFFMLSHLEEDGPVRLDGVKLGVCEVMGLEIDEPKLGAFAGALNACDFPVQLLIRQHPPRLGGLRDKLREAQPGRTCRRRPRAASESLRRLLTELEARDGILDRRFYAVCEFGRFDELRGLLARAGLSVHPFSGRRLRMLMLASALGGTPAEIDEETPVEVEMRRREVRVGDRLVRSLHLGKWPRSLAPGFLQSLMAAGAPMDLSIHLGSIPAEQAARTLEWQKVRFESAQSLSFKRGRTMSPEAEIALEDVTRLRDEVQRGRERLFHASLSITLHAKRRGVAEGDDPAGEGPLRRHAGQARSPGLPPARGHPVHAAPGPQRRRRVEDAGHVQHSPPLSLLAARPGHPQGNAVRHRHAGLRPGGLRPLGRDAPERQHRRPSQGRAAARASQRSWESCAASLAASPPTSSTPKASTRTWRGRQAGASSLPAFPARA